MAQWESAWGDIFETETDARENVIERMDWTDYKTELQYSISFFELLDWAREHDGFYDRFADEIQDAENEFFRSNYSETEEE